MIPVTKTYLPDMAAYVKYLEQIWERGWITNQGPLVEDLERQLKELLGVKHLLLVSNGTIALQIAIKALELQEEIITTPFSYVATTSSIVWQGCRPVFADIDPRNLTIDPGEVEKKITAQTTAILATHVYGSPCAVEAITTIAEKHRLRVIYDAAHAFGVDYNDHSLMRYGDVSTLSFHATKLFHTAEGGAVITDNDDIAKKLAYHRNFGHLGYDKSFWGLGINGKCSELHAAMGLCMLPKVADIIGARKEISGWYDERLENTGLEKPQMATGIRYNYAYYPVVCQSEDQLLGIKETLNQNDIFPRRYFYPSLNTLNYVDYQSVPIAEDISRRVMCLPLYAELSKNEVEKITSLILSKL